MLLVSRVGFTGSYGFTPGSRTYSFQFNATILAGTVTMPTWTATAIRSVVFAATTLAGTVDTDYNAVLAQQTVRVTPNALVTVTAALQTSTVATIQTRLLLATSLSGSTSLPTQTLVRTYGFAATILSGTTALLTTSGIGLGQGLGATILAGTTSLLAPSLVRGSVPSGTTILASTVTVPTWSIVAQRIVSHAATTLVGTATLGAETGKLSNVSVATIFSGTSTLGLETGSSTQVGTHTATILRVSTTLQDVSLFQTGVYSAGIFGGTASRTTSTNTTTRQSVNVVASLTGTSTLQAATLVRTSINVESYTEVTPGLVGTVQMPTSLAICSSVHSIDPATSGIHVAISAMGGTSATQTTSVVFGAIVQPEVIRALGAAPSSTSLLTPP